MRETISGLYLLAIVFSTPACAQTDGKAQLSSVTIPDMTFHPTTRDIERYDEYFYFYRAGVTAKTALDDIRECATFSSNLTPMARIRNFVPLGEEPAQPGMSSAWNMLPGWGLVGVGITAIAIGDIATSVEKGNFRRCMGYKGYLRFGTSREIWSRISKGSDEEVTMRLAVIASGAQPQSDVLEP